MLEVDLFTWFICIALGALTSLDAVSWPQAMISRPLVSATLGGALLGAPLAGLAVGAILELLALRHLPLGAATYPDTGPAGVVAGAAAAGAAGPAGLAAAAIVGWATGWIGARTVTWLRGANTRVVGGMPPEELAARPARLKRRHGLAMAMDAGRGALLVGALLVPAVALAAVVPRASAGSGAAVAVGGVVGAAALGAGAGAGALTGDRRGAFLVALGAAGMLVLRVLL